MELRRYLQILERRKWIVIIVTAITLLIVGIGTYLATPVYAAFVTVRVAQIQDNSVSSYDLNYSERLINTYVELVRSRPFLEETIQRLGLDVSADSLGQAIKVEAIPNTELLRITAQSEDPVVTMDIANTLGDLLVEQGGKLYSGEGKSAQQILLDQLTSVEGNLEADRGRLQSLLAEGGGEDRTGEIQDLNTRIYVEEQTYSTVLDAYEKARLTDEARANSISIVDPAVTPVVPIGPRVALNIVLGAALGLMGGVGLAFLFEYLDLAIYSPDELEQGVDAPLLGAVPNLKAPRKFRARPLLLRRNGQSAAGEAFRVLRTNVLSFGLAGPPKKLLITSIEPGAGKSTVLANLAVALAQSGRKVVAVDSDLRDPCLDKIFDVSDDFGLSNAIFDQGGFSLGLRDTKIPGLCVLPSGPLPPNPTELLEFSRTRELVGLLAQQADVLLLDSPPLRSFADASVLAPLVDGVVLVVSRGSVSGDQIQKAVAQLVKVGAKKLGFVFNKAEDGGNGYQFA
jgi:capsular exopolysaccharide synthesis family protein